MKKSVIAVVLMVTLGSSIFFVGCSSDLVKSTQGVSEKQVNILNEYVEVVNWFNDRTLTFSYAIDPNLADMKAGNLIDHISLPEYFVLQKGLKQAVEAGETSFKDVNKSAKEVLSILDEMVPLTEKMKEYYDSKQFTTDNNAQGAILVKQYLELYAKFEVAYNKLDNATQKATYEIVVAKIKAAKDAGHVQEATLRSMYLVSGEITKLLEAEKIDADAINAKVQELQQLNEFLNPKGDEQVINEVKSFKERVNRFIGQTREYTSGNDTDMKRLIDTYNDMIEQMNAVDPMKLDK